MTAAQDVVAGFAAPFETFDAWFADASAACAPGEWATPMTLATATADGAPSARMVLMQRSRVGGVAFYTNGESRKAGEFGANPRAAAVFFWPKIQRQVRLEGVVRPATVAESDEYFASRPRGSQLAAWASAQSRPLPGGSAQLRAEVAAVAERFAAPGEAAAAAAPHATPLLGLATAPPAATAGAGAAGGASVAVAELPPFPRPAHCGLYWLEPSRVEFWREGEFRMHERVEYTARVTRSDGSVDPGAGWAVRNLYP